MADSSAILRSFIAALAQFEIACRQALSVQRQFDRDSSICDTSVDDEAESAYKAEVQRIRRLKKTQRLSKEELQKIKKSIRARCEKSAQTVRKAWDKKINKAWNEEYAAAEKLDKMIAKVQSVIEPPEGKTQKQYMIYIVKEINGLLNADSISDDECEDDKDRLAPIREIREYLKLQLPLMRSKRHKTETGDMGKGEENHNNVGRARRIRSRRKIEPKVAEKRKATTARHQIEQAIHDDWKNPALGEWNDYQDYVTWKNEHLPEGWSPLNRLRVTRAIENVKRRARYTMK